MDFYFAPMEGITGYIFRNTYEHIYGKGQIKKYFTPFISPTGNRCFTNREKKDILKENNHGIKLIPQILANDAKLFQKTVDELIAMGYEEVNLNLGCPSGTVVSKGKGSGFLIYSERLKEFLDEIYRQNTIKISIKTRIGRDEPEEFYELLELFNEFPILELIIHPRVRKDMYKYQPRYEFYQYASEHAKAKLCYNGDIYSKEDYMRIKERFFDTDRVMLGRGLLSNPQLVEQLKNPQEYIALDVQRLENFLNQLTEAYKETFQDEKNVLFKLKQLWIYLNRSIEDERGLKKIKKSKNLIEYQMVQKTILEKYQERMN